MDCTGDDDMKKADVKQLKGSKAMFANSYSRSII